MNHSAARAMARNVSAPAEDILTRVRRIVAEHCGVSIESIPADARLRQPVESDKYDVDSLDLVEIVMECEDGFGIELADEEAEKVQTVQDLADLVARTPGAQEVSAQPIGLAEPKVEAIDLNPAPAHPVAEQRAQQQGNVLDPQGLIDIVTSSGKPVNVDQMERLLGLQLKWLEGKREQQRWEDERNREREARAAVLGFREDFARFRGKNIIVPKTKPVDRGKAGSFMQAEFHVVAALLSPALSECGFSFRHDQKFGSKKLPDSDAVEREFPWVWVTCFLEHRMGHSERMDLDGPADDKTANTLIQNLQSSASMLKRISLLGITGTATGGEDDEDGRRRRSLEGNDPDDDLNDPAVSRLVDAGNAKAEEGLPALTSWWSALQQKDRDRLMPHFGGWKKTAAGRGAK